MEILEKIKKWFNKGRSNSSGFTLVELLVVIAIISLLSTTVMVSISGARAKARDTIRLNNLNLIVKAIEMYHNENGVWPGMAPSSVAFNFAIFNGQDYGAVSTDYPNNNLITDLIAAGYFTEIPGDPIDDSGTWMMPGWLPNASDVSSFGWLHENGIFAWGGDIGGCCISINNIETTWAENMLISKYGQMKTRNPVGSLGAWNTLSSLNVADFVYCFTPSGECTL